VLVANPDVSRTSLQVLDRTFTILDLFGSSRPEWTTTEIARACGLPIPTVHRILVLLWRHDYLAREESTKRFRLGLAAVRLGDRARAMLDIRTVALPVLKRLAAETGETALLTILSEDRRCSVCVERIESAQPLRLSVQPGTRLPLHAGASQKALLAFLPKEDIEVLISNPLERLCRATITDSNALRMDLAAIRRMGYATSNEETNLGVWGVAVPVIDDEGDVVAALGMAGPNVRLAWDEMGEYVRRLHSGATEMARTLGFHHQETTDQAFRQA
jgi:IclR family transcriptional regulator, acetate operon repressor